MLIAVAEIRHKDFYVAASAAIPVLFLTVSFSPLFRDIREKITDFFDVIKAMMIFIVPLLIAGVAGEVVSLTPLLLEEDHLGFLIGTCVAIVILVLMNAFALAVSVVLTLLEKGDWDRIVDKPTEPPWWMTRWLALDERYVTAYPKDETVRADVEAWIETIRQPGTEPRIEVIDHAEKPTRYRLAHRYPAPPTWVRDIKVLLDSSGLFREVRAGRK